MIYFNPREPSSVLGINILEPVSTEYQALTVSALINIFHTLWKDSWGPRLEDILRNSAFALLDQPHPVSLVAWPKLLTEPSYRAQVMRHVSNPVVRDFFEGFEKGWDKNFREEAISPVLNKVRAFTVNPIIRDVIGQPKSSFDFRQAMDSGKILLCDLSKGALGEDVSSLLGSLIVTKLFLASLSRQDTPEDQRRPHILYADEVQNFIYGVNFPTILSEARKYKLILVVATQNLGQLPKESVTAIFGNCGSLISFRVSGADGEVLAREFGHSGEGVQLASHMGDVIVPGTELQDLADYKIFVATLIRGRPSGPHLLDTFPPFPKSGNENKRERVIRTSLERFGRPRTEVEAKLNKFLSR